MQGLENGGGVVGIGSLPPPLASSNQNTLDAPFLEIGDVSLWDCSRCVRLQSALGSLPSVALSSAGAKGVFPVSVSLGGYRVGKGKRQLELIASGVAVRRVGITLSNTKRTLSRRANQDETWPRKVQPRADAKDWRKALRREALRQSTGVCARSLYTFSAVQLPGLLRSRCCWRQSPFAFWRTPSGSVSMRNWPLSISFVAPVTRRRAGNSWGRPKGLNAVGRIFIPAPSILRNCGYGPWETGPWSRGPGPRVAARFG